MKTVPLLLPIWSVKIGASRSEFCTLLFAFRLGLLSLQFLGLGLLLRFDLFSLQLEHDLLTPLTLRNLGLLALVGQGSWGRPLKLIEITKERAVRSDIVQM